MRQNSQCVMELDFGSCLFFAFIEYKEFFLEEERNQYPNSLGGKVFSMRYSSTKKSQGYRRAVTLVGPLVHCCTAFYFLFFS